MLLMIQDKLEAEQSTRRVNTFDTNVIANMTRVELVAGNYETALHIQFWKEYMDRYTMIMMSPTGDYFIVDTD